MKNILAIIRHDVKHCTGSVVAIVIIMGLCIVPCLYAWFNIFSNWAPYEPAATGRIKVAVANADKGATEMGLTVNVGEKIVDGLEANHDIGWQFADSPDEAIDGVYSGDYYAAVIIPEEFSENVLSFLTGDLTNPRLLYYENEKKNAIAPKITGKAKTALQEEVDRTFIETLAKYLSEAASVAESGEYDPQQVFRDIADKMEEVSDKIGNCIVMINSAQAMSDAAQSLLDVSDNLIDSARDGIEAGQDVADAGTKSLSETSDALASMSESLRKESALLASNTDSLNTDILLIMDNREKYNNYVAQKLQKRRDAVLRMEQSAREMADTLDKAGLHIAAGEFRDVADGIKGVLDKLDKLVPADDEAIWEEMKSMLRDLREDLVEINGIIDKINSYIQSEDLSKNLRKAIRNSQKAIKSVKKSLAGMDGDLGALVSVLDGYNRALDKLSKGLGGTDVSLEYMQSNLRTLAAVFDRAGGNQTIGEAVDIFTDTEASIADYLASPVKMRTEVIYPIETYGSAMAPFYTVLAQWVGALLTAVLVKTNIRRREDYPKLKTYQHFFGRYGLYMFVGLAQALIVSLGDLLYIGIQCHDPVKFVLAACMNGITFTMINYALVFALENIGLAAGVIILVLQVAGSGGTYPVEVLPDIFKALYPFMPFRYAMDAMRECIGGFYDHNYAHCMGVLGLFVLGSAAFGILLHRPAGCINRLIAESKEKSEIML